MDQWFYERHWSRTERPIAASPAPSCWMVFLDSNGLGTQIALQLRGAGHDVIEVNSGGDYQRIGRGRYTIRPGVRDDYDSLLADLIKRKNDSAKNRPSVVCARGNRASHPWKTTSISVSTASCFWRRRWAIRI